MTAETGVGLVVRLAPPDREGVWLLSVLASGVESSLVPVEVAMVTAGRAKRLAVEPQLARLERLCPVLARPGGQRRGEVALSTDEAWTLMSVTGPVLAAAGFEVQVPPLSRRRPHPAMRMFADALPRQSAVGAQQLCQVRWSVVFDDVELNAADIAKLAAEARPLVKSRGRWIELDQADLQEAAAALAERASSTELSGAAVLRHALGLETSVLAGPGLGRRQWLGGRTAAGHVPAAGRGRRTAGIPGQAPGIPGAIPRVAGVSRLGRTWWLPRP